MKRALTCSALLHLTVLVFILIGFYNPFEKTRVIEQPLMIEFVQVAEQSAAPRLAPEINQKAEPKNEPPKPAPPKPPMPDPTPPTPPAPAPAAPPEAAPVKPEPVKPAPAPDPKPEAEPVPDPRIKPTPELKPEKPKPQKAELTLDKKKKPEVKKDDANKDLKKKPELPSKDDQNKEKKKKHSKSFDDLINEQATEDEATPSGSRGSPASTIGPVPTASEMDALGMHMRKCWIIPAGLRDARNIRVPIKINVAADGTVQKAEIMDKSRMAKDPAYRSAAESARRAVLHPQCNPLPIPPKKYDQFKEFIFNFDPKEMF